MQSTCHRIPKVKIREDGAIMALICIKKCQNDMKSYILELFRPSLTH